MDSHNFIKKTPRHSLGGRPPKFTIEARTVILDALRAGKSYASACLAADISPVALFMWRRAHPRFDAQCRNARARGKAQPNAMPGQATMLDSNGNIVPNSEIVADEKERFRLIRLREQHHGITRGKASPNRLSRRRENYHDEVAKRLLKLREDYEAEERRKTEIGSVTAASEQSKRDISDSECLKEVDKVTDFEATDNLLPFSTLPITSDKTSNIKSEPPENPESAA